MIKEERGFNKEYIQGIDITDCNMEDKEISPVLFEKDTRDKEEKGF